MWNRNSLFLICVCASVLAADPDPPVARLLSTFESRVEETGLQEELRIFRLRPLYLNRLQEVYDHAVADGNPELAQAVLREQERFSVSNRVEAPLSDHNEIRELQQRWMALARREQKARAERVLELYERLDEALAGMERTLTTEGEIDEALAVRAKRNELPQSEAYLRFKELAETALAPETGLEREPGALWVREVRSSTPVCTPWPQHKMEQAFDGNPETRWQGDKQEGEWIEAVFYHPKNVNTLVITWEVAHAKSYQIHARLGQNWRMVAETHSGKSGRVEHPVNLQGVEAVRIDNMKAGTQWPPSIFSVEVK